MPSLAKAQANFIATINDGPNALDASIFAGDTDRVLLGLKAHANTISHARLIALEDTFPRCREAMGDTDFNAASRAYCDTGEARMCDNSVLGGQFGTFLSAHGCGADITDLAAIEWLWLKSYNAAETPPLTLTDLADLDETALFAIPVAPHPAAFAIKLHAPISGALPEFAEHRDAHALLTSRPEAEVRLTPLGATEYRLFSIFAKEIEKICIMRNLLELSAEQNGGNDTLTPIIALINAGALASAGPA